MSSTVTAVALLALTACSEQISDAGPRLRWYVFDERSGAFEEATRRCTDRAEGAYSIELVPLPSDADQQREQLVRRLAAGDRDIDLIGMDVIWTAELAAAGWILPWSEKTLAGEVEARIPSAVQSASYEGRLWALPFTTNTQLLWYRKDRVEAPPVTWGEMIDRAEALGRVGTIQAQGERYEGLTVFFVSLLASSGGRVLDANGQGAGLARQPLEAALGVMRRLGRSPAADPALANNREDQARLAFETGGSSFMVNYTYVWASLRSNRPEMLNKVAWARWPAVEAGKPSRVTIGGINLGVAAFSRHPELAFDAARCLASEDNQRLAAQRGGLPPTLDALYDDPAVKDVLPFAKLLRETLRDAVQRPQTPLYSDVSLAIARTLHPMSGIQVQRDSERLRAAIERALRSEGLL